MEQTAVVVSRMYDFSLWLINKVQNFPRSHRAQLGDRLVSAALDLLLALVQASYTSEKAGLLDTANRQVHMLRYLLRLSKDLHLMSLDSYAFAAAQCEEVGRMTGGWRKQIGGRP